LYRAYLFDVDAGVPVRYTFGQARHLVALQ
jgi:hypothetical protein